MGTVVEEPAHYLESPRVLWGEAASTIAAAVVRRGGRSGGCRLGASLRPGVHATKFRLSNRCHYWLHRGGNLPLCRNDVLSEPGPHMASSFGCSPDPGVCALRTIGDFTHYGRRLARGLRSHDDARRRVGDLRSPATFGRNHEAPSRNAVP